MHKWKPWWKWRISGQLNPDSDPIIHVTATAFPSPPVWSQDDFFQMLMETREHLLREADGNKIHISSHYYSSGLTWGLYHSILSSPASRLCSFLTWNIGGVWDDQEKFCLENQRNSFPWNSPIWTDLFCLSGRFSQETEKLQPDLWTSFHHPMSATFFAELVSWAIFIPAMPLLLFIHPQPLDIAGFSPESFSWNNHCCISHGKLLWGCVCAFSAQLRDSKRGCCCSILSL